MSRTFRKTLERRDFRSEKRSVKVVPDGKCEYYCDCEWCTSKKKKKLIDKLYYKEIEESLI